MKRILIVILITLLVCQVVRSLNITTNIKTSEDVNTWTNINTTGNVGVYIDGVNWTNIPEYIEENEEDWSRDRSGISASNLATIIEDTMLLIRGLNQHYSSWHVRIANALLSVFVTRPELQEVKKQNQFLLYRIEALENTMEKIAEKEYCRGKIDVMIEHNLTKVSCQNTTYYNPAFVKMDKVIGIEPAG